MKSNEWQSFVEEMFKDRVNEMQLLKCRMKYLLTSLHITTPIVWCVEKKERKNHVFLAVILPREQNRIFQKAEKSVLSNLKRFGWVMALGWVFVRFIY
jgi:hypothetical protein